MEGVIAYLSSNAITLPPFMRYWSMAISSASGIAFDDVKMSAACVSGKRPETSSAAISSNRYLPDKACFIKLKLSCSPTSSLPVFHHASPGSCSDETLIIASASSYSKLSGRLTTGIICWVSP